MKIIKTAFIFWFFILGFNSSCVKNVSSIDYTGSSNGSDLTISKPIVKKEEPLLVSAKKPDANSIVKWTINPSAHTVILPADNYATIFISFPGIYMITASYYKVSDTTIAYDSSFSNVTVSDSLYVPPPAPSDTLSLEGDQIRLMPNSDSQIGLFFLVLSKNTQKDYFAQD